MPRAVGTDPRRSPEADRAVAEFQAQFGCLPFEAPDKFRDWLDILERYKTAVVRTTPRGPKPDAPMREHTLRVLELIKASPKPLSLVEIAKQTGLTTNSVQTSVNTLMRRNQVTASTAKGQGSRSKLVYAAMGVDDAS